jgi:Flp pilus assembly protein TadG
MRLLRENRGAALIESAIITLSFLIFVFALLEAGRLFSVRHVVTEAAREGARYSVTPESGSSTLPTEAEVRQVVHDYLQMAKVNVPDDQIVIDQNAAGGVSVGYISGTPQYTRVTVTAAYKVLTIPIFAGLEIDLIGESLMRNETSP